VNALSGQVGDALPLRIGVCGASGRMGQALLKAIDKQSQWMLAAAWVSPDDPVLQTATGINGVYYSRIGDNQGTDDFRLDVVVDFSSPQALEALLAELQKHRVPLVIGTTGLSAEGKKALQTAAETIPVLWAPNFSLTVWLLQDFLNRLARIHAGRWQARIRETHRAGKKDAPSGTALALAEALVTGHTQDNMKPDPATLEQIAPLAFRLGPVALESFRRGQVAGVHEVEWRGPGERLQICHTADSPELFAHGALQAAAWLAQQRPGSYSLDNYLQTISIDDA